MFKINFEEVVKGNKKITKLQRIIWKAKVRMFIKINVRRHKKEFKKNFDNVLKEVKENILKEMDNK